MPKATDKTQLLADMQKERLALEHFLKGLSPDQMSGPAVLGAWTVKDVLAHLVAWEQMVLGWFTTGQRGDTPHLPAEGYKWNELPALNQHIYEQHRDRPLVEVLTQFRESYPQIQALTETLCESALFHRGYFPWAGNNAMASYINSCTASHYRWARKEIQKGLKAAPAK